MKRFYPALRLRHWYFGKLEEARALEGAIQRIASRTSNAGASLGGMGGMQQAHGGRDYAAWGHYSVRGRASQAEPCDKQNCVIR